jgi:predicted DNA-binding protein (MmcQ/YjbR family)
MNLEKLEKICISKNSSIKEYPFGDQAMVFKVMNKMFGFIMWEKNPLQIVIKSDPQDAIGYREIYDCVTEGYYMNKKHWITVALDGTMKDEILIDMIDESYNLVVNKLTKKEKLKLLLTSK